ncbi:MAG: hypothetical protein ACOC2M_00010 [bacterium]
MDFTIKTYQALLNHLAGKNYSFLRFSDYLSQESKPEKFVILRHDVDALPVNSLQFAKIQSELGIAGTYYFRAVPQSWDEAIIKEIHSLGHEVGYHYENMDTASSEIRGQKSKIRSISNDYAHFLDLAYEDFQMNLEKLRKLVPVNTICMHGSPRSKFDNKAIWEKYDYKNLGILGEPYFDVDFDNTFYLTDTGRRWDGWKVSIRDKVPQQEEWNQKGMVFPSTIDIIRAVKSGAFPEKVLFTFHPQRWHNQPFPWLRELLLQSAKNQVKGILIRSY